MSALPPIPNIARHEWQVRFVPIPDTAGAQARHDIGALGAIPKPSYHCCICMGRWKAAYSYWAEETAEMNKNEKYKSCEIDWIEPPLTSAKWTANVGSNLRDIAAKMGN